MIFIVFSIFIETKLILINKELDSVAKYLKAPKKYKDECEILFFLAKNKKLDNEEIFEVEDAEVNKRKTDVLQNLINENIVRKTSTLDEGKIFEFHSPKYDLAVKRFMIKP